MEQKVIYENGSSKCWVEFDGEIVTIKQELDGEIIGDIMLYIDELESSLKFVKETDVPIKE